MDEMEAHEAQDGPVTSSPSDHPPATQPFVTTSKASQTTKTAANNNAARPRCDFMAFACSTCYSPSA